MSKTFKIFLLLGLLVASTQSQDLLEGHTLLNTFTDNSSQCNLHVNGVYQPDRIIVNTFYSGNANNTPDPIVAPCHYQNFVMDSMWSESINYTLHLVAASNNPTMVGGYFLVSDLQNLNGTACVILPQTEKPGVQQYLCRVRYDVITIYFAVWGTGNFTFDNTTITSLVFIQNAQNAQNISMTGNAVTLNTSFPAYTGALLENCGSSNSNVQISSLSTAVTVSTSVNLTANLGGYWLAYILVKQEANGGLNHTGQYIVVTSKSNATLFGSASPESCWLMGINYGDILPNMDYCSDGCEVSFVLMNSMARIYVLQTTGVTTNSSASNNGNGANTGNNTVVSSGCFTSANVAFIFISLLYLVWF